MSNPNPQTLIITDGRVGWWRNVVASAALTLLLVVVFFLAVILSDSTLLKQTWRACQGFFLLAGFAISMYLRFGVSVTLLVDPVRHLAEYRHDMGFTTMTTIRSRPAMESIAVLKGRNAIFQVNLIYNFNKRMVLGVFDKQSVAVDFAETASAKLGLPVLKSPPKKRSPFFEKADP
ncbi:hypothetical protein [Flavobacterium caeni]|uniref:Uncharacterized protein n=1 Tax=Flavobacterium caeni TaxID=490189 RepID=A0A1G5EB13_9FLAO|nr:hypothetical protein [Flavobacterium caeni]SCY24179.1 hypothetical protein SAMN02927903_01001 [Flavobacterium caeni]